MLSPGDTVLYAVSSQRSVPWASFKLAVDAAFSPGCQPATKMKYLRSYAAALGDSLGHWDIAPDGQNSRICVAPPVLAQLPWPGPPRAIMCGSRSPDTVVDVVAACRSSGKASARAVPQQTFHPYAPSRIELRSSADDGLAVLAAQLGITYAEDPPAWALAIACCTLTEYLSSLEWEPDDNLGWPRRDFDPGRLAFGPPQQSDTPLRLSMHEHPRGWTRFDRLWRDGEIARIDRAWARYAVLASAGICVLRYNHRAGTVTVPRQVPLPRLVARSLALCSGQAPAAMPGGGLGHLVYSAVPESVFEIIASKLGQQGSFRQEVG
jgi:hypothetical protein